MDSSPGPSPSFKAIRPAVQAGRFYHDEPDELRAALSEMLRPAPAALRAALPNPAGPLPAGWPMALLAPHAGHVYSGAVAGAAFAAAAAAQAAARQAGQSGYTHALVLAPSHYADFHGAALPDAAAFETPLGATPLDIAAMRELIAGEPFLVSNQAHMPEHSIEVALPFLQTALGADFKLLPALLGRLDSAGLAAIATTLAALLERRAAAGERWLIVASSDTYHGYDPAACLNNDRRLAGLLPALTPAEFVRAIQTREIMACGWTAIAILLSLARRLGAQSPWLAARGDSQLGRPRPAGEYVVGYLSAVWLA